MMKKRASPSLGPPAIRPADLPPTRMPDGGGYRALPHRTISPATKLAAFASADAATERPGSWLAAQ